MKALFLIFQELHDFDGISKKILYQVDALRNCGLDIELSCLKVENRNHYRMIGDRVVSCYGAGKKGKILKRVCYGSVLDYVASSGVKFVYIRSIHNSNPAILNLVKKLHKAGVKCVMEIPTYPYDDQFSRLPLSQKVQLWIDQRYRWAVAKCMERIVTFSEDDTIFGCPTVKISNGIDFSKIQVKTTLNDTSKTLNLIAVASITYWHGFDRMVEGLARYYEIPRDYRVILHVVGCGHKPDYDALTELVKAKGVDDYVIFHGALSGEELDRVFDVSDFGVASLGRHRSGITHLKALKNREYAARGIPFAYSEIDVDFENTPYVMKVPADESPIDVEALVAFHNKIKMTPAEIRGTIEQELSWNCQMKKVIEQSL